MPRTERPVRRRWLEVAGVYRRAGDNHPCCFSDHGLFALIQTHTFSPWAETPPSGSEKTWGRCSRTPGKVGRPKPCVYLSPYPTPAPARGRVAVSDERHCLRPSAGLALGPRLSAKTELRVPGNKGPTEHSFQFISLRFPICG